MQITYFFQVNNIEIKHLMNVD